VYIDATDAGTDFALADTDGDACGDGQEVLHWDLDPTDPWDFYSVPVPALRVDPTGTRNGGIGVTTDVIALLHYVGLTAPEVGAILGIPVGTVYSRLHYGARTMRAAIAGSSETPSASPGRTMNQTPDRLLVAG
jgi:hypothetical protein